MPSPSPSPMRSSPPIDATATESRDELIAPAMTNRQIGEEVYLAEKTVKNYVSNLLAKARDEPSHGGGLSASL
jgi:DNA-binding NarL/FixJ family response regulator